MTVRDMRSSDAGPSSLLLASSFPEELRRYLPYAQAGTARFLADQLAGAGDSHDKTFLVYEHRDQVAGFAEFRLEGIETAFLAYVCVADWARRRGIATALLESFVAGHPAVRRLDLDVFEQNQAAARLYEGLGFATIGTSSWYQRALPQPTLPIELPDGASMQATHERYSFSQCQIRLDGGLRRVGRIGRDVLRCFDRDAFGDDVLLSRLRATFPSVTEALLVGVASRNDDLPEESNEIVRSRQMMWELPGARGDRT